MRYFIASSDDFIWGHPGNMVASPASSSSGLSFIYDSCTLSSGVFTVKNRLFWGRSLLSGRRLFELSILLC